MELPAILYHIRYSLRAYFQNKKDKKFMNIKSSDLGFRLHELAVGFNSTFDVEVSKLTSPHKLIFKYIFRN
jgi:hypothetical protein